MEMTLSPFLLKMSKGVSRILALITIAVKS